MSGYQKQAFFLKQTKEAILEESSQTTWDSESESEEEVDTVNMYFMANNNTPKVTSEPSLDDCD